MLSVRELAKLRGKQYTGVYRSIKKGTFTDPEYKVVIVNKEVIKLEKIEK